MNKVRLICILLSLVFFWLSLIAIYEKDYLSCLIAFGLMMLFSYFGATYKDKSKPLERMKNEDEW